MSYISKVWCLIDILAEDPFKRYPSFFSCQLYEIQFKYIRKLNIQSSHGMFNGFFRCHTGNDDGAPKRLKKCREIIFMKFVIASLVTRLNFDESKKLICENCHSVPVIRGEVSRQTFLWQIIFSISANLLFPFPISAFYRRQSEREQINQSLRLHRKPQVHSVFFLGKPSFWLYHQL